MPHAVLYVHLEARKTLSLSVCEYMLVPLQASPLSELHKNSRAKAVHEERAREAEERFKRDHTFKPSLYRNQHAALPSSRSCLALPQPGQQDAENTPYTFKVLHDLGKLTQTG